MKIAYVVNARIPTEKAHGYQIMRTCSEWKKSGINVTLYVPERFNYIKEDAFSFYGIEKTFDVVYVKCSEWVRASNFLGPLAFYFQSFSFARALKRLNVISSDVLIYTRNPEIVSFFSNRGNKCIYNAHNWPSNDFLIRNFLRRVKGVVCNSEGTEDAVRKVINVPTSVVHNATDKNPFKDVPKVQIREKLGLPKDKKIITYMGHLYGWKGTNMIIPIAKNFRTDTDVEFYIIGGTPTDIEKFSKNLEKSHLNNIKILGFKKKSLVPKYLAASDTLLLPNMPSSEESVNFTSPLKLFEYMASGVPIVASDLPSIKSILSEKLCFFAKAGDASDFVFVIRRVLSSLETARDKAGMALIESEKYSWSKQSAITIEFLKSL